MEADKFDEVIDGKHYRSVNSVEIGNNAYLDMKTGKRLGATHSLFRTKNGNYFSVTREIYQSKRDALKPLTQDKAILEWNELPVHLVRFEEAFPGVTAEDA